MVKKVKFFQCFSINLLRWLKANCIYPVGKNIHPKTGRTYWIFEVDERLSQALTAWSKNKSSKK